MYLSCSRTKQCTIFYIIFSFSGQNTADGALAVIIPTFPGQKPPNGALMYYIAVLQDKTLLMVPWLFTFGCSVVVDVVYVFYTLKSVPVSVLFYTPNSNFYKKNIFSFL